MELLLKRTYFTDGTNGKLYNGDQLICFTIELPWLDNKSRVSCIPEGRYELMKRYSPKFQWHLWLQQVAQRQLILIHPANDALKELKGCIALVSALTGSGKGSQSRAAFKKLCAIVFEALERNETVTITIQSESNETDHLQG